MTLSGFLDDLKKQLGVDFSNNSFARMIKDGIWSDIERGTIDSFAEFFSFIPGVSTIRKVFGYIKKADVKVEGKKVGESEQTVVDGLNQVTGKLDDLRDQLLGGVKKGFDELTGNFAKRQGLDVSAATDTPPAATPPAAAAPAAKSAAPAK